LLTDAERKVLADLHLSFSTTFSTTIATVGGTPVQPDQSKEKVESTSLQTRDATSDLDASTKDLQPTQSNGNVTVVSPPVDIAPFVALNNKEAPSASSTEKVVVIKPSDINEVDVSTSSQLSTSLSPIKAGTSENIETVVEVPPVRDTTSIATSATLVPLAAAPTVANSFTGVLFSASHESASAVLAPSTLTSGTSFSFQLPTVPSGGFAFVPPTSTVASIIKPQVPKSVIMIINCVVVLFSSRF
jgi:hypothetical protein